MKKKKKKKNTKIALDVVVATVLGRVRERGRERLKTVAEVVNIVVVMKHKSVVVVDGYKTETMIGSGGGSKKQIDGGGRCLRHGSIDCGYWWLCNIDGYGIRRVAATRTRREV